MRWAKIAIVTAGLMFAGGLFGTIAGMLVLGAWIAALEGPRSVLNDLGFFLSASMFFGGGLGALLGPITAWVLMRHVPLWLAVGGTTLGTLTSGGIGLIATADPVFAMFFGIFGFGASALWLHNYGPGDGRRLAAAEPADAEALPG